MPVCIDAQDIGVTALQEGALTCATVAQRTQMARMLRVPTNEHDAVNRWRARRKLRRLQQQISSKVNSRTVPDVGDDVRAPSSSTPLPFRIDATEAAPLPFTMSKSPR